MNEKERMNYDLRLIYKLLKQMDFKCKEGDECNWLIKNAKSSLRRYIKESIIEIVNNGDMRYSVRNSYDGRTYNASEYYADSFLQFLRTGDDKLLRRKDIWIYFNKMYYNKNEFFLFENNIYNKNEYYLYDNKLFPLKDLIKINSYNDNIEEYVACKDENIGLDEVTSEINCQDNEPYIQIYTMFYYTIRATSNAAYPFVKYKGKRIIVKKQNEYYTNYLQIPLRCASDFTIDMSFDELKQKLKDRGCTNISDIYFPYSLSKSLSSSTIGKLFKKCIGGSNSYMRTVDIFKLGKMFKFFAGMATI